MALGKKIIEYNYVDIVKGMSSSDEISDAGFAPSTDGANLVAVPGVMYNPPVPTDASAGMVGEMIASCEDPTGNYARLFTSTSSGNGSFFSLSTSDVLTQRGSTDSSHGYVAGKTDMIAFDNEAYITTASTIVRWSAIGGANTFDTAWAAFSDSFSPHPALTFNNFAYYGDGNLLLRQSAANVAPITIMTLPTSVVIVALGIDPGSGLMLLSVIGQINLSDTINSGARVGFYDGFSSQVSRYVPVEDMVTGFYATEGSLYASYGQNLGVWNGSGITFLRRFNIQFDNAQLMYKQHFTSIGSTLMFIERARVIAYGPVRQKGDNIFYPALTNTINGSDVDLTHIANIGQNKVSMSYASAQFAIWNSIGLTASPQELNSNSYNFDDELWVRRARIVYNAQISNGVSPGNLVLYDQDGLITEINSTGEYSLENTKGFSSAFIDINNINLRLKELTFGLLLNQDPGPTKVGSVATAQNNSSVTTLTIPHTVNASLEDSLLLVMVTNSTGTTPTGTYNGTAMTAINYTTANFFGTLLYLRNPTAGTNDIVVNWLSGSGGIGVTAFTVQNAGVPVTDDKSSGSGTTATLAVTSTLQRSMYVDFIQSQSATHAQGTGQTELSNFTVTTSNFRISSSYKRAPYPGTGSMSVTLGSSVDYQINGFTIPPATSPINPGIRRVIFYGDLANITGSPNA